MGEWRHGKPGLSNIVKLCQIFRLSADELIGGDLALERPTGTRRHAINEPAAAYRAPQPYRMPDRLAKSYADLNEDGKRLVEAQLEVAIETALRMYGHRAAGEQNAA